MKEDKLLTNKKLLKFVTLALCYQLKQLKKQPEKKFNLERELNPWPCDAGAMLYPLSFQVTWIKMVNCDFIIYPMILNIYIYIYIYEYEYMKIIYVNCGYT